MPASVITTDDLYIFKEELIEEIRKVVESAHLKKHKWLRSQQVQDLLNISAGTLHNLRESGILPHSKIGNIILYDYDDIVEVIRKNKV